MGDHIIGEDPDLFMDSTYVPKITRKVNKTKIHGEYSSNSFENDIALIKMDSPVPLFDQHTNVYIRDLDGLNDLFDPLGDYFQNYYEDPFNTNDCDNPCEPCSRKFNTVLKSLSNTYVPSGIDSESI